MNKISILLLISILIINCSNNVQLNSETEVINNIVTKVGVFADQHKWEELESLFADQVLLDYTSMIGGVPQNITPDQIIKQWKGFLPGFDHTFHHISNLDIKILKNKAEVYSYVHAVHFIKGENPWHVYGTYYHSLEKTNHGWKITKLKFNFKFQEGNNNLPQMALEKMK